MDIQYLLKEKQVNFAITNNDFTNNYNLERPRIDSVIMASQICIFNETLSNHYFYSFDNDEKVDVLIVSCVDQRGKLKTSRNFNETNKFSLSEMFTESQKF